MKRSKKYSEDELIDKSVFDHLIKDDQPKLSSNKPSKTYAYVLILLIVFGGLIIAGVFSPDININNSQNDGFNQNNNHNLANFDFSVYSSQNCGCCHIYADYLENLGYSVQQIYPEDLPTLKDSYSIPKQARSCHTAIYGQYFIEGHIPIEAINKLQSELPSIDGISLPGMPQGSPGMEGEKIQDFEILSVSDGEILGIFVTL